MPVLTPRRERFCQLIASGTPAMKAYGEAGYKPDPRGGNVFRLRHRPEIEARIEELLAKARHVEELATERAIERVALSKEALARELVPSAVSNIADYVRINDDGDPVIDFSKATRQQLSAIKSLQVETYVAGRGDNAREVKRVKFQLHEKVPAAMGIARLFGWVVERRGAPDDEVRRIADRLNQMTDEQRLEDAKQLAAQIRARLDQDRLRTIEGKATEIED